MLQQSLHPDSAIRGGILCNATGYPVETFGLLPSWQCQDILAARPQRRLVPRGHYYDVAWPYAAFGGKYTWIIRHDMGPINREMRAYALAIAGLVAVIATFVTLVTMVLLERLLIVPIVSLRDDLIQAGEAVHHSDFPQFATSLMQRQDELGQVFQAFAEMFGRVCQAMRDREAAQQTAHMASRAKGEFLANMSHELRTPLNGILGYAQILARSPHLTADEQQGVEIIYQSGMQLLALINDILDITKIEASQFELTPRPIDLPALLQNVVAIFQVRAEAKHLTWQYDCRGFLPAWVLTDEKRLRQVLMNLLSNAIKFTPAGGVIFSVTVMALTATTVELQFQVTDTGIGIAAADLPHLFTAFEQVGDRTFQQGGTGLGLAISQAIVQLMDGTIQVTSELGQGSEFTFSLTLPLVTATSVDCIQPNLGKDLPPADAPMLLPPVYMLKALLTQAEQGNVPALRAAMQRLMVENADYRPFADAILVLARQFKVEEIEDLLQQFLGSADEGRCHE